MSVRRRQWKSPKGEPRESWEVHVHERDPDGKAITVRRLLRNATKPEAIRIEAEIRTAIRAGTYGKRRKQDIPTFAKFADEFLDKYAIPKNKPSEVESKRYVLDRHLVPAFGALRIDQIGEKEIDAYKARKIKDRLKPKTVNNQLGVLGKALRVAKRWGYIDTIPEVEWLRVRDQPFDFLTFDEADRLLAAAEEPWRTMMLVALRTGLRPSELRALRWQDVDLVSGKLYVRQGEYRGVIDSPKDGDAREVDLSPEAITALRKHRHLRGQYVFCDSSGNHLTEKAMRLAIGRASRKAGMRALSWYVFRHSFASHLVMRGAPLRVVADLMGHATIQMTMRYAHLSPASRRDAVALLDAPAAATNTPTGTGDPRAKNDP